mgnify:CR=1 FL=1
MNDNWIEIVETLQPYVRCNSTEPKYQQEIENCLKFLGWRSSNKTMQSQVTINIGHKNSIRPDIVLYKNDIPVLPIEIKRPNNICNMKQESQLMSYMRQLRLNIGLYIGENIQLYYDNPNDFDSPVCVFKVEFRKDDTNGDIFCEMFSCGKFDTTSLEYFCKERYNQIIARNNLQQRLNEFLFSGNATKNIITLIKEKFTKEGFEDEVLNAELSKLDINVNKKENHNLSQVIVTSSSPLEDTDKDQDAYFSFDGIKFHCKRRFVLELIKHYVQNNPNVSFEELEIQFPAELHRKSLGVVRTLSSVNDRIISQPDLRKRYFLKENEIITLSDGTKVVVNNQWGTLFTKFLEKAKSLYHVTSRVDKNDMENISVVENESMQKRPANKLRLSYGDGSIIMEHDSVSTFKVFIENIGVARVAALNIRGRKDTPLISKQLREEYRKFQHPMSNGYFLLLNHSTESLRRLVEEIALKLNIIVSVAVVPKQ